MQKIAMTLMLALAVVAPLVGAAGKEPAECTVGTSTPTYTTQHNGDTVYVVVDAKLGMGGGVGVFLYEESNGVSGLQRKDALKDDTCGAISPDAAFSPA